jgi:hypothetical protein
MAWPELFLFGPPRLERDGMPLQAGPDLDGRAASPCAAGVGLETAPLLQLWGVVFEGVIACSHRCFSLSTWAWYSGRVTCL